MQRFGAWMFEDGERARPGYLVNRAAGLFRRVREAHLRGLGVGPGQVPVLMALRGGRALTQKTLAEVAMVEQPTMAQMLARMERDALIERTPDPSDRRSSLVRLTPVTEATLPAIVEALEWSNERAMAGLSEEERTAFADLLGRVIANLEAAGESPP